MSFRGFLPIWSVVFCGALSPLWPQVATSLSGITRDYVFPPVGLGSTETASITVVNTATASSTETASTAAQTPSCSGTISFSNANGMVGTPMSFTVGSEEFKTVTLPFASAGLTGIRGEIEGKVSLNISPSSATPCSLMFSLETYDSTTGATHAVLSNSAATVGGPFPPIVLPGKQ